MHHVALALSLCLVAACSSSSATSCPLLKKEAGPLGDYSTVDLPIGPCQSNESCPEIVTRQVCPHGPEIGPSVIYACSCQRGTWACVETGRSKAACNSGDVGDAGADAAADGGTGADALEPGACPGPNPGSCHFGGGPTGVCDHVGHAATCRDGAWVCTDERGTPLVSASQCRCYVTGSARWPCRCEGTVAVCEMGDAGGGH